MKSKKIVQSSRVIWVNELGELHRVGSPAVLYSNGYKEWWQNGQPHRLDGPSCLSPSGNTYWHIRGVEYDTEQEWFEALSKEDQIFYLFKMEKQ